MEKPKIISKPTNESLETAHKWQAERFDKSPVEKNELLLGKYHICVNFTMKNGEDYSLPFRFPVSLASGETFEDLKKKALGEACAVGLHNFGMNVYKKEYPDGHPVKFVLKHETGEEIEFTQNFNGGGYPVYEK